MISFLMWIMFNIQPNVEYIEMDPMYIQSEIEYVYMDTMYVTVDYSMENN